MKIYTIQQRQFLPITIREAWDFFSSPENLAKITPAKMNFRIVHNSGSGKIYAGQVIRYKVRVLPFYSVNWMTEITHVQEPFYFVDDQRFGPYSLWHHQHHFKEVPGGIEMSDEINYAVPYGWLGQLANWIFVGREVNAIFSHRFTTLEKHFSKKS